MLTLKRWIAGPGLLVAVLLTGCGRLPAGATDVRLTGFAARDSRKEKVVWIKACADNRGGVLIPTYARLPLNTDFTLHVQGTADGKQQDYNVLAGADPGSAEPPQVEVHSSAATVCVQRGWVVAVGQLPMGDTRTTQTSSTGTTFVIRNMRGRDTIYHLKDHDPKVHDVYVSTPNLPGKTFKVDQGFYLVYEPAVSKEPKIDQISEDDEFLKYVRSRAALAGFPLE